MVTPETNVLVLAGAFVPETPPPTNWKGGAAGRRREGDGGELGVAGTARVDDSPGDHAADEDGRGRAVAAARVGDGDAGQDVGEAGRGRGRGARPAAGEGDCGGGGVAAAP